MPPIRPLIAMHCQSFDDFPTKLSRPEAESTLKCWTSMWHPSVLNACGARPDIWEAGFSDEPIKQPSGGLLVVPHFVSVELADQSVDGSCVVNESAASTRIELTNSLVRACGVEPIATEPRDAQLANFFALGYAWLQVRLMTLHVRYSTNLDDARFDELLLKAAAAWTSSDRDQTEAKLTACFDLLLEEKNNYYSVQPELVDLVMLESTTLGSRLNTQLQSTKHLNVIAAGHVLEQLAATAPQLQKNLSERIAGSTATLIGGVQHELPANLLPLETQLQDLLRGRETAERLLGVQPNIFARRQFGLTSFTPGLLEQLDFAGACHMTLDGGQLPEVTSSNLRWVGDDGQTVPALAVVPLDAADSRSFLALGIKLATQIDSEHVATALFAHWPDRTCDAFADLQNVAKYGGLLGDFIGLDDYFEAAYDPGYGDTFTAEQYESPLLERLIAQGSTDPVSRFINAWQLYGHLQTCQQLATMIAIGQPQIDPTPWLENLESSSANIDALAAKGGDPSDLHEHLASQTQQLLSALSKTETADASNDEASAASTLVVNGHSFPTNASLRSGAVVEIPATGYRIITADESRQLAADMVGPPIDDGLTLRNEFFQLNIDTQTGGIRSLKNYASRATQASQRLSIRLPESGKSNRYADMIADEVRTERRSSTESCIVSRGRLIDPESGDSLCQFTQTVTLARRAHVAEVVIQLDPSDVAMRFFQNAGCYVCSRLAWHDETASLFYGTPEIRHRVQSNRIEAPAYVRVEQSDHALTLVTGGLPWHQRRGRKMLDSLLIVGNEQRREFRLGIGSDCERDLQQAIAFGHPPRQQMVADPTKLNDGWLFHFNSKNVVVSHSRPIVESGRTIGVAFRLFETQGRRGKMKATCPFEIADARRVTLDGRPVESLSFEGRRATIEFSRNEYFQIHLIQVSN